MMELSLTYENDQNTWKRIINDKDISPFHSPLFLEPIKNEFLRPLYLKIYLEGELVGGISGLTIHSKNKLIKKMNLLKQAVFYSGPFFTRECPSENLANALYDFLKKEGYSKFIIRGFDNECKLNFPEKDFYSDVHDDWIINLNEGYDSYWKKIRKRGKAKISKANRNNLIFKISNDPDDVKTLFLLLDETRKSREERELDEYIRNNVPFVGEDVIRKQVLNGIGRLAYITNGDEILSMQYFICHNKRSFGIYIGTNKLGYELGANAKVFCDLAKVLVDEGISYYNIGHTSEGPGRDGLVFFKSGIGAEKTDCYAYASPVMRGKVLRHVNKIKKKITN